MIKFANLPRVVCQHLIGDNHGPHHRMVAGVGVMAVGVAIAKVGGDVHAFGFHYLADMLGYLVHGIGCVPFVEYLVAEE